jgi:hypothetical protein
VVPLIVPLTVPLDVSLDEPLGLALGLCDVASRLTLSFVFVLVFALILVFVFVLPSVLDVSPVAGEALGLELVAPCEVSVDWVPEPMFVELDWLVEVDWSPEPTLLDEFWLPVPMFVLGLTLVFGLIVTAPPLGVVPVTLGVLDGSGVDTCAAAGPMPRTNAASEAAAIETYGRVMQIPLSGLGFGICGCDHPRHSGVLQTQCHLPGRAAARAVTQGLQRLCLLHQARGAPSSRAITVRWIWLVPS